MWSFQDKPKKKKVNRKRKANRVEASTAGEAIQQMLLEKKLSSKINYDILKNLDQPPLQETSDTPDKVLKLSNVIKHKRKEVAPPEAVSDQLSSDVIVETGPIEYETPDILEDVEDEDEETKLAERDFEEFDEYVWAQGSFLSYVYVDCGLLIKS